MLTLPQTATLGAVHIAVFVRRVLLPLVTDVRTDAVPTGLGNVVANKGGAALAMQFGGTRIAFIAAHLTAHHHKTEQRNADFHRLNATLRLTPAMETQGAQGAPAELSMPLAAQFDHVFWFGDLNYRINGNRRIVEETVKQGLTEVFCGLYFGRNWEHFSCETL